MATGWCWSRAIAAFCASWATTCSRAIPSRCEFRRRTSRIRPRPTSSLPELQEAGIVLDVLVNNAGFGGTGSFLNSDWDNEAEMIHVNITR